jgi:hypothetical protein
LRRILISISYQDVISTQILPRGTLNNSTVRPELVEGFELRGWWFDELNTNGFLASGFNETNQF